MIQRDKFLVIVAEIKALCFAFRCNIKVSIKGDKIKKLDYMILSLYRYILTLAYLSVIDLL